MPADMLRLFVFARHAESAANAANVLNTNPSQPVALTARGRTQARALGAQLANLHVDLAVGTRRGAGAGRGRGWPRRPGVTRRVPDGTRRDPRM